MEDKNLAMFTHAMDFFKEHSNLKKPILKHFFTSLLNDLSTKYLVTLTINKIHETQKMTLCNSKQASLCATKIKAQYVKPFGELWDDSAYFKTTRGV
jgi:hypothetical protein